MLASKYALHDVDDVEQFCSHVARMFYSRTQTRLLPADHEDLVQYLLVECWRLSGKYTPTTARASFKSYAYSQLNFRCTDFLRTLRERTRWQWKDGKVYQRERPEPLHLDAPVGDGSDTLGSALTVGGSDDETDRVPGGDLALHVDVDLLAVRDLELIQANAPRVAPRRAAGPRILIPRRAELEESPGLRRLFPGRAAKLGLTVT